jgi:hypothetical protein
LRVEAFLVYLLPELPKAQILKSQDLVTVSALVLSRYSRDTALYSRDTALTLEWNR